MFKTKIMEQEKKIRRILKFLGLFSLVLFCFRCPCSPNTFEMFSIYWSICQKNPRRFHHKTMAFFKAVLQVCCLTVNNQPYHAKYNSSNKITKISLWLRPCYSNLPNNHVGSFNRVGGRFLENY